MNNQVRILLIDSNDSDIKHVLTIIENSGEKYMQVDSVCSFYDALHSLKTKNYELVIIDFWLSDCNGLKAIQKLRKNFSSIPVIAYNNFYFDELIKRTLELGAHDFLDKNHLTYEMLSNAVRKIFQDIS